MRTVAVVLAGGSGERFGTPVPKQLLPLAGRPMIEHSVAAFERAPAVDRILVVMAAGHADEVRALLKAGGYAKLSNVIDGGPTRTASTRRAIAELGQDECDVLFHDAARPLVSQQT
ncbi:MAG TPA: 2-C-methyl-D-erythritol 4-phosphate cytidylyltransferase, partial [Streptosporangiaceae bacterium]